MSTENYVVSRTHAQQARPLPVASMTTFLSEGLGKQLLAVTVGVTPRTLERWAEGVSQPQFEQERKLRNAYQVFQLVQTVEAPATVRAWFMGMNPQLEDLSPAEVINEGRGRDALAAARAFVNAG